VSTLLGYNPPPPDYSDHVKWGGLGKTGGNSQQKGEREGEASVEPSAKVAQPAKAEQPSPQKAPPAGAANKQTGILEGGALLYVVTVLVTGAVVGYVSAWLFEEANQIVVRSGPGPDGPWQDAGIAPADAYAGLVGNGLMETLVSDYSADINASMEGFTPPRLGGFELGEGTPPEPTVTPRLEVGNTIFSTPWTNEQILERLTTPTQQPGPQIYVTPRGISTGVSVMAIEIEEAYDIAYGHGWRDHQTDWISIGINSEQELAEHLEGIMANPSDYAELIRGRRMYWDDATGTIIIENATETDKGTAFVPLEGKETFDEIRRSDGVE